MFKKTYFTAIALAVSVTLGGLAVANSKPVDQPLQSSMQAYVISTDKAGKDVAKPATEVEPGQVVEYRLTYKNVSDQALKGIAVTGPIPNATDYMAETAGTKAESDFVVSIDGGKTFEAEPVKRIVTDENGKQVEKIIPPSEYSHVRWNLKQPLSAGETETFVYRSVVN